MDILKKGRVVCCSTASLVLTVVVVVEVARCGKRRKRTLQMLCAREWSLSGHTSSRLHNLNFNEFLIENNLFVTCILEGLFCFDWEQHFTGHCPLVQPLLFTNKSSNKKHQAEWIRKRNPFWKKKCKIPEDAVWYVFIRDEMSKVLCSPLVRVKEMGCSCSGVKESKRLKLAKQMCDILCKKGISKAAFLFCVLRWTYRYVWYSIPHQQLLFLVS